MRIAWGLHIEDIDMPPGRRVEPARPELPIVGDVEAAVVAALEQPFRFPPLQRALTPEDRVAIVIDPALPKPAQVIVPVLGALKEARIEPAAVTLVCLEVDQEKSWVDDLPDEFQEVHIETHNAVDRKTHSYLATTKGGHRIYLNRTTVDADQTIVLTRRSYDAFIGHAGGPSVLYPGLGDEETHKQVFDQFSMRSPRSSHWKLKTEADEVCWLLGAPFFVQALDGPGETWSRVIGGTLESCRNAEKVMDADWRVELDQPVDIVIATLTGEPAHHTFADMARALAHASRLVKPGGRLVLLCDAEPEFGPGGQILRDEEEIHVAQKRLDDERPADFEAASLWLVAAQKAKLYVLSQASPDTIEEMFATPLDKATQIQRLVGPEASYVVVPDAHKTYTHIRKPVEKQ